MIKPKYPIYVVVWDDAESDSSWTEESDHVLKPTLAVTLGYLIAQDDHYVVIANSYFVDPQSKVISNTTKIPRGMIKEIDEVNVSTKKKIKRIKISKSNSSNLSLSHKFGDNGEGIPQGIETSTSA